MNRQMRPEFRKKMNAYIREERRLKRNEVISFIFAASIGFFGMMVARHHETFAPYARAVGGIFMVWALFSMALKAKRDKAEKAKQWEDTPSLISGKSTRREFVRKQ